MNWFDIIFIYSTHVLALKECFVAMQMVDVLKQKLDRTVSTYIAHFNMLFVSFIC